MARPPKPVDLSLMEKLAAINCSMEEIANAVGLSRRTLQTRYCAVIEKGRSNGKVSLKRKMFETAMNGNVTMMIWLSKQMLGYHEPQNIDETKRFDPSQNATFKAKLKEDESSKTSMDSGALSTPLSPAPVS